MGNATLLFELLSYATQNFREAYALDCTGDRGLEDSVLKKVDAANFIIADIWMNGDKKAAEELMNRFGEATERDYFRSARNQNQFFPMPDNGIDEELPFCD